MGKIRINKKIGVRGLSLALTGTLILSMAGCYTGTTTKYMEEKGYTNLEGRYIKGYYLKDSAFDNLYVIETEDGKKRIVDNIYNSVYSTELYYNKQARLSDLYLYLDAETLNTMDADYTGADYVNLEKVVNGEADSSILPSSELNNGDLIIAPDMYYQYGNSESNCYYTSLSEIQIFFLEEKAYKITRKCGNSDESIDIISGSDVNPNTKAGLNTSFNYYSLDYKNYEYVNITDLFPEIIKEEYTGEELIQLYYLIVGKTKEEIKEALKEHNETIKQSGTALTMVR